MLGFVSERIAGFAVRRSGSILVVAVVAAVLSLVAASRLRLNPEIVAFLPAHNRAVADFPSSRRYLEAPADFLRLAPETGKAVVMAAATAIVGYGSFALSHYPGLQSIGYAATFGIGMSCLAAITLLPAILVFTRPPSVSVRDAR